MTSGWGGAPMTAVTIGSRSAANASSCSGEETLAKLFFAEYGTVDDLRAAATAAIEQGRAALEVVRRQGRVYVEAGGEFPERLHLIALAGRFICGYGAMLMDYGEWVQAHTADWESTNAAHPDATMQVFRDIIAEADRRLGD